MHALRVPVPEDAPHHHPSRAVLLDDTSLLTSWVEGRATTRLGVLDLRSGGWSVVPGLRGPLRAAVPAPGGGALVLTDHGLSQVDLATQTVTQTLRTGIGKNNDYLHVEGDGDDGLVVVGSSVGATETVVDGSTLTVVRRRRRPPLTISFPPAEASRAGVVRVLAHGPGVVVGATQQRPAAPQRLLVVSLLDGSELASADLPDGLSSAHLVRDGVVAAPADLGSARTLTVLPGLVETVAGSGGLEALVATATESAEAILSRRSRRTPTRTVLRDHRLEVGAEVADLRGERITLDGCAVARATEPGDRPRVSRVHVTDLEMQSSTLSGAVLEDVTVDGLRAPHGSGFLFGCELRRVTLRGRVRGLVLDPALSDLDPETESRYARWYADRLEDPEWMLDLTEATGDITIRGYPSRFVRRNPRLHAVVTAEAAASGEWRTVDPGRSALRVALLELARSDWEDVLLVADPHGAHAEDDLRYLQDLRALGVASTD